MSLASQFVFTRLLTDIVRIWREPDPTTVVDSMGHVPSEPQPIGAAPTVKNARPAQNWSGNLADPGPGEQQNTLRTWLLAQSLQGVRERDVLEVIAGPHIGQTVRVMSVELAQDYGSVHHVQVSVEIWHGTLAVAS